MQQCSTFSIASVTSGARLGQFVQCAVTSKMFRVSAAWSAVALMAIIFLISPQVGHAQCTNTQSGLLALYANSGSPNDSAGYNYGFNNATLVGAPSYVSGGNFGTVLQLNGTTQYMQLPNGILQDNANFSVSIWFQTTASGVLLGAQNSSPFNTPTGSVANAGWDSLLYVGTDGKLYSAMASTGFGPVPIGATPVNDGNWHHAVLTVGPFTEYIYVDNVYRANAVPFAQWSFYSYPMSFNQIGVGYTANYSNTNGGWFPFNGLIGQVAFYNRVLNSGEVSSLYSAGVNGVCLPTQETVTATAQSVTPGNVGALSPTYTYAPAAPNWAPGPTCYSSANGASQPFPAFYENAINCYGAAAPGFAIAYQANTLTSGTTTAASPIVEPDAVVGERYQQAVTISGSGSGGTYSTSGTLPPGIGIDPGSGVLTGIPNTAGDYSFGVTWTNGSSSGSQTVLLKVLPGYGELIASAYTPSPASGSVYSVDPNTGAQNLLATFNGDVFVDAAVDSATGIIYAVSNSGKVYSINSSGTVSTFFSNASVTGTYAIAVDNNSNVYIASQSTVYKLNSSGQLVNVQGTVTNTSLMANPVAGANTPRMIFDRDGNLVIAGDTVGVPRVASVVLTAAQQFPTIVYAPQTVGNIVGMAFARDGSGDLILADATNNSLIRISEYRAANVATTLMTSQSVFSGSLVGVAAGNVVPFNEYFVGESTGFGTYKVVPQTSGNFYLTTFTHQSALTWFRYNQSTITIQAPSVTSFIVGTNYNFPMVASGGNGHYTWSATGLAPGLTLSPSGVLSGSPMGNVTNPVTFFVTDTLGNTGSATFTLSAGGQQTTAVTLTVSNQVIAYGGALPQITYATSPSVSFNSGTAPTCSYSGLPSPLNAGTYTGAIVCGNASLSGYTFTYVSGSLTVNPATLTVTANSFVTPYGTALPTLTANITGFVNNEDAGTATTGSPALSVSVPSGNPAGVYTITASQGTLAAKNNNYTFTFANGTLTISPVQQTPTLSLLNNYILTGDYVARSTTAFTTGLPGMSASSITIPAYDAVNAPDGVPVGAEVVAAYLYWQALEPANSTALSANAMFNGYNIYGNSVGTDLSSGCWSNSTQGAILRAYRSNVTAFLPVVNGANQMVGTHNLQLATNSLGNGATLVVIYRYMAPASPLKATVIYEGNWSQEAPPGYTPTFNLNLIGFYDSLGLARVTDITGLANTNGTFNFVPAQSQTTPLAMADTSDSVAMPNNFSGLQSGQCRVWAATVVNTAVHASDNDGIIDSWKTGPKPPNPNAGQPGYYDAQSGAWVPLPGAAPGHHDLFVQLDYMVGADGHSHQPSANALSMVQSALSNHGITPHFITGHAIPEDTCTGNTTDPVTGNTLYCVFPNEPGVVAWKVGLEDLKTAVVDSAACANDPTGTSAACQPRFPFGQRNTHHYVLFGHSLGIANWSINDGTLLNISVVNGVGTVNLKFPFKTCPTTVTISNAMVTLELNGTYTVNSCGAAKNSFTITTVNVPDGTYPGAVPEPALGIVNGTTSSISGYSDVGGSDSAITLGKWGTDGQRDNVVAGTLMHELGHTLGLSHGGSYGGFGAAASYEPNCKPNYQSVMNYLFQIDLLGPNAALDFSGETLGTLVKSSLGSTPGGNVITGITSLTNSSPLYTTTSWYGPVAPFGTGSPATRHCDGSLPGPNELPGYLVNGAVNPIAWSSGQDVNFDGSSTDTLQGYNDWLYVDFRQIGSTGSDVLVYPLGLSDGGIQRTGGGGIQRTGGGGIQRSGGGGIQRTGGGGIQRTGGGGIQRTGGGGIQRAGGGGIQRTGGGGVDVDAEVKFETANAVVRPPRAVVTAGNIVTWSAPLFGNVTGYNIYRSTNGGAPVLIASVSPAPPLTYTDNTVIAGQTYSYIVTTIVTDVATGTVRESTAPNPPTTPVSQTITFPNPGPVYFGTQNITLHATATSGLPVTYTSTTPSVCTVSAATLHMVAAGTCSITASQAGSSFAKPAPNVTDAIVIQPWTIAGFNSPVAMPNPTIVWNVIKGGQTVPLKFNVYIGTAQQTSTSVVIGQSVSIAQVTCGSGSTSTDTAVTNTGNTSLTWDGSQFIQNWKTPSGSGHCYSVTVKTLDSSSITGYFQTK